MLVGNPNIDRKTEKMSETRKLTGNQQKLVGNPQTDQKPKIWALSCNLGQTLGIYGKLQLSGQPLNVGAKACWAGHIIGMSSRADN